MAEVNIVLSKEGGVERTYETSQEDLGTTGFIKAEVKAGTWILYMYVHFNGDGNQCVKENILIMKSDMGVVQLPFSPMSIWKAEDDRESATVFEHFFYGGVRQLYQEAGCLDISASFPAGTVGGASSLIIWPGKSWELFTEKNYKGDEKLQAPGWYISPTAMGFPNDALQSLRPH